MPGLINASLPSSFYEAISPITANSSFTAPTIASIVEPVHSPAPEQPPEDAFNPGDQALH